MNRTRRRLLAGVGTAGIATTAGCLSLDFIRGEEALSFEAESARVTDSAVADSGYTESRTDSDTIVREFAAGGQRREVEVTNQIAEYDRGITVFGQRFRGALFIVLSTPQVDLFDRTFNPVGDMDTDELIEMIQERYDEIGDVTREDEREAELLDESREVVTYRADGEFLPTSLPVSLVDLTVHITEAVAVGDDFVLCVGIHPREIDDSDAIDTLLAGVEHHG